MIRSAIDRILCRLFYTRWTPDALQEWWYEHVCRPAAAWEFGRDA
jgi:hypothetical protein